MSEGESLSRDASREVNAKSYSKCAWMDISVDFIMGLPEAQGYDAILVCDRFIKQVHIIPTTKEMNSLGLALWKGQLACLPTPPFPGILDEHLHLVPIPLSYLILPLLPFILFLTM